MSDLDNKIEEIKVKIYELQKDLAVIMNDAAKPKKWHPVGGEWFINQPDDAVEYWKMSTVDTRDAGLERPTEQQAERAAVEMRRFNRLLALRDELGAGNWIIGKTNYYIYYDYINGNYRVCTNSSTQIMGAVYFTSQESVKKACDMLNSGEVEL